MSYKDTAFEVSCVLAWSEPARIAYVKALDEYRKAGRPLIPLGATNYRITYRKKKCARHRGTSGNSSTTHLFIRS